MVHRATNTGVACSQFIDCGTVLKFRLAALSSARCSNHIEGRRVYSPCSTRQTWLRPSHFPHNVTGYIKTKPESPSACNRNKGWRDVSRTVPGVAFPWSLKSRLKLVPGMKNLLPLRSKTPSHVSQMLPVFTVKHSHKKRRIGSKTNPARRARPATRGAGPSRRPSCRRARPR